MIEPGLEGKRGIVAGGASGLGRAMVVALEREGVSVATVDRRESDVGAVRIQAELGDHAATARAVHEARDSLGGIDLLVHTAAIARHEPILRLTREAWEATLGANLSACVWTCREAAASMITEGGGVILVVGSTTVYTPARSEAAYRVSKAGVKAFVELLAIELASDGIRVNLLTPGAMATPMLDALTDDERTHLCREIPLHRIAAPDELTATALLLLSDRLSPYTTGAEFIVDGGIHLRPMPEGAE